jgi:hypothetical protein
VNQMVPSAEHEILVCRNVDELNRKMAEQLIGLAGNAIEQSGRFAVALSGGSTPKALYSLLASPDIGNVSTGPAFTFLGRRALRAAGSPGEQFSHGAGSTALED